MQKETATFGAGCFWHVQLEFSKIQGVIKTEVGYMGGDESLYPNPTYEQVSSNKTGYAEVIQIEFDPDLVSYSSLLNIFWENHDPTQKDRQGLDIGTQYRSVIFYHSKKQKSEAEKSKNAQKKHHSKKIVTQILQAKTFFRAEEYHQDYLKKHNLQSCNI